MNRWWNRLRILFTFPHFKHCGKEFDLTFNQEQQPIRSKTVFVPIIATHGFDNELERVWDAPLLHLNGETPEVPYVKVRIEIIEVNQKYSYER